MEQQELVQKVLDILSLAAHKFCTASYLMYIDKGNFLAVKEALKKFEPVWSETDLEERLKTLIYIPKMEGMENIIRLVPEDERTQTHKPSKQLIIESTNHLFELLELIWVHKNTVLDIVLPMISKIHTIPKDSKSILNEIEGLKDNRNFIYKFKKRVQDAFS